MGSTKIEQPTPPQPASASSSLSEYISLYPQLFSLMKQYAPQETQMQLDLANQYAGQLGSAYKKAQDEMYPNETAITNALTQQVQQGMSSELPSWAKQSYMDTMRSQLGDNALSGSGADYMSVNMLNAQKNWQDYYRNLGMSISGKQPVYQAQPAQSQYTNQMSNFTPQGVMNYNAGNYGNYSNAYSSMYGVNSQGGGNFGGLGAGAGMAIGGLLAAPTGGMSIPMGALIGGGLGGGMGSMFRY